MTALLSARNAELLGVMFPFKQTSVLIAAGGAVVRVLKYRAAKRRPAKRV